MCLFCRRERSLAGCLGAYDKVLALLHAKRTADMTHSVVSAVRAGTAAVAAAVAAVGVLDPETVMAEAEEAVAEVDDITAGIGAASTGTEQRCIATSRLRVPRRCASVTVWCSTTYVTAAAP